MPIPEADRELLRKHLPELRYHVLERYRADSASTLTDSYVPSRHANALRRGWPPHTLATAAPSSRVPKLGLAFLVPESEPYPAGDAVAERGDYLDAHAPTLRQDSVRMHAQPGMGHVIYCRVAPGVNGRRWLQYWFFFYDNPFHVAWIGRHQGDWEMIQVGIDKSDEAFAVTYAQHERGARREWDEVPKVDAHRPVVYIAKDSHASYFVAGEQERTLPFAIGNDHTSDGVAPVPHIPYFLDPAVDRWLGWPGNWGGSRAGPLGTSPPGPAFQTKWRAPEAFHADAFESHPVETAALDDAPAVGRPMQPTISAMLEPDALVVRYAFPAVPRAGDTDPVRLEVAVHAATGLPMVAAYDVASLDNELRQPLPAEPGPYTVHIGVYDADDAERLLAPLTPSTSDGEGGAALEDEDGGDTRLPPPVAPGAALRPLVHAEPLRVLVRAPDDDPVALVTLNQAVEDSPEPTGGWTIAPLFGSDTSAALARWFSLSAVIHAVPGLDIAAMTFEAALALQLPDGWVVEPDVPSTVFRIDPPDPADESAALEGDDPDRHWALKAIRAPEAWALTPPTGGRTRGEGVLIGQPDTGYTDHPELLPGEALDLLRDLDVLTGGDEARAVLAGFPPLAFPSHGTGTASVAVSREAGQITGSAPRARVVPIRAAETVIHVRNAELAVAVEHAHRVGCHVITMSMGGVLYPAALRATICRAVEDGLIVMAAAGQPLPMVVAPASFPECLAVAGTRADDKPWKLSARGEQVDWSAPAHAVWVAATRNAPGPRQFHVAAHAGTSFAVALSAGVAALWLAHHGRDAIVERFGLPNVQAAFCALVCSSVRVPEGWDARRWGAGIIDAEALLSADLADVVLPPTSPPQAFSPGRWALDRAADLADDRDSADVARRVLALFGGDESALASHADELVYRLAEHAAVREEVLYAGDGEDAALEGAGPSAPSLLAVASPSLRSALV